MTRAAKAKLDVQFVDSLQPEFEHRRRQHRALELEPHDVVGKCRKPEHPARQQRGPVQLHDAGQDRCPWEMALDPAQVVSDFKQEPVFVTIRQP